MDIAPSLSVVIPVYNSEQSLCPLLERLAPVLAAHAACYEVILVNDGSRDRSWEIVCQLAREYPFVRGTCLMRNYGQHNALLCGIRMARFPVIVTMDDDLQHPPEEIPLLLEKLAEGHDVVYGVPAKRPHSTWRNFFSTFTKWAMAKAMGIPNMRDVSAFRAFRADLRRAFENFQSPHLILDVLLSWATVRFEGVTVRHDPRTLGTSNYNFRRLFHHTMLLLTGYSTAPLRWTSMMGLGFTVFGILVLVYVIGRALIQKSVPGFPFLASLIALFGGAQLFALGIIGEYLARMFNRSMERPVYTIREMTDNEL